MWETTFLSILALLGWFKRIALFLIIPVVLAAIEWIRENDKSHKQHEEYKKYKAEMKAKWERIPIDPDDPVLTM